MERLTGTWPVGVAARTELAVVAWVADILADQAAVAIANLRTRRQSEAMKHVYSLIQRLGPIGSA